MRASAAGRAEAPARGAGPKGVRATAGGRCALRDRPARRAPRVHAAWRSGARTSGDHGPVGRRAEGDEETERSASKARRVRGRRRVSATAASAACSGRSRVAAAAAAQRRARSPARRFQQRCRTACAAGQRLGRRGERAPLMNAPGGVILRAAATRPPPVCVEAVVPSPAFGLRGAQMACWRARRETEAASVARLRKGACRWTATSAAACVALRHGPAACKRKNHSSMPSHATPEQAAQLQIRCTW